MNIPIGKINDHQVNPNEILRFTKPSKKRYHATDIHKNAKPTTRKAKMVETVETVEAAVAVRKVP